MYPKRLARTIGRATVSRTIMLAPSARIASHSAAFAEMGRPWSLIAKTVRNAIPALARLSREAHSESMRLSSLYSVVETRSR